MRLALDLNAFFASCEQQEQPDLRGKPVVVVPVLAGSTSCIAASYPAKHYGIKTGTRLADARLLCPSLVVLEARPWVYLDYHHRIVACVDRLCPVEAVTSIDEVICELPAGHQTYPAAAALARKIKAALRNELGICMTCSIGIAPNAWLAKVASDMQKPDGLVLMPPESLPQALYGLALRDLCGIARNMEARLNAEGIHTVQQLCEASALELRNAWGSVEGLLYYRRLRGEPVPLPQTQRGSVGHSHVLPPNLRNAEAAQAIIHRMLQKAATRLRRIGMVAGQLDVQIRWVGQGGWSKQARFAHADDTHTLSHHLQRLWQAAPLGRKGCVPLQVGVVFSGLRDAAHRTQALLPEDQGHPQLMAAMDKLNQRYGKNTIYLGAAHKGRDHAPMRIAFTRIPDADEV